MLKNKSSTEAKNQFGYAFKIKRSYYLKFYLLFLLICKLNLNVCEDRAQSELFAFYLNKYL